MFGGNYVFFLECFYLDEFFFLSEFFVLRLIIGLCVWVRVLERDLWCGFSFFRFVIGGVGF